MSVRPLFVPGRSAAVARLLWEQDVAGSIPVAPTIFKGSIGFPVGPFAFKLNLLQDINSTECKLILWEYGSKEKYPFALTI